MGDRIYKSSVPKYFRGDNVGFRTHQGNSRFGDIVRVETHYSRKNNVGPDKAYHIYSIWISGYKRQFHVDEEAVFSSPKGERNG
jgi:hypothetical protein